MNELIYHPPRAGVEQRPDGSVAIAGVWLSELGVPTQVVRIVLGPDAAKVIGEQLLAPGVVVPRVVPPGLNGSAGGL